MANLTEHEPHGTHQTKKATASGWIGSALEYYDFFIYATAASLVFPQIFFPSGNPTVAIVASLATYGVGYVARPIGAFFLGHWGDTHGRKTVLLVCMFLMGFSTMAVGVLPTYQQVGMLAPTLLVAPAAHSGLRGRRRDLRRQFDDPRARSVRTARLFRQFQSSGRAGRADLRRGGLPAAGALHAAGCVQRLGLADPLPAERGCYHRGLHHPSRSRRNARFRRRGRARRGSEGADRAGFHDRAGAT